MDNDLSGGRTARVLVMGDTGVGKSEFLSELCGMKGEAAKGGGGLQAWVSLERGLGGRKDVVEFVELCGDTSYHKSVRWPMFNKVDAIVLVYDLTDDSSAFSLRQWKESYDEYVALDSKGAAGGADPDSPLSPCMQGGGGSYDVGSLRTRDVRSRGLPPAAPAAQQSVPVLVVGTHKDAAGQRMPGNPSSFWRRLSQTLSAFQRTMASILRQVLFLPMPSFLFAAGGKEQVTEELRALRNTWFLEWSSLESVKDNPEKMSEAHEFLSSLLELLQPTV